MDLEIVADSKHGHRRAGVGEPDRDPLAGHHDGAAAAYAPLYCWRFGDVGWWSGGSAVAEASPVVGAERVGQGPQ